MTASGSDLFTRRACLLGGLGLGLSACAQAGWPWSSVAPLALRSPRTIVWRDFLGVNAQFQWFDPRVAKVQLARLQALGLNWVRLGLHWMLMEPKEGDFQLGPIDQMMAMVKAAGLHNITYVVGTPRFASSVDKGDRYEQYFDKFPPRDPALYAQRMAMLAKRYPQVDVWQVWNEPNLIGFWAPQPDPVAYGKLFLPTYQALRAVAPDKPVALAGMAYFSEIDKRGGLMIQELGKLGAFNLQPIVAYHPYTASAEGSEGDPRDFVKRVVPAHQWLRAAGVKQVWATEWGWSSYAGPKEEQPIVGEDGQADQTLRRLALMAALDYDRVFLFTLSDLDARATQRDQHYGLLRLDGEPKPVYHALQRFLQICGPQLAPDAPPDVSGEPPEGLIRIGWRRADGRRLAMVWAAKAGALQLKGWRKATVHNPLDGKQETVAPDAGSLRVAVATSLRIVVEA
jgi:beta-xylosidase